MKTAEEILKETIGEAQYKAISEDPHDSWMEETLKAMEAYRAQFAQQPTEKTANWDSFDKVVAVVKNAIIGFDEQEQDTTDLARCITGALIQSGYIQSDSVDAEQAFEKWWKENCHPSKIDSMALKADYKEAFFAGLSSKVKPVNDGWINYGEKSPEIEQSILVCIEYFHHDKLKKEVFAGYLHENGDLMTLPDDENSGWCFDDVVTHWQPLPSPPKV